MRDHNHVGQPSQGVDAIEEPAAEADGIGERFCQLLLDKGREPGSARVPLTTGGLGDADRTGLVHGDQPGSLLEDEGRAPDVHRGPFTRIQHRVFAEERLSLQGACERRVVAFGRMTCWGGPSATATTSEDGDAIPWRQGSSAVARPTISASSTGPLEVASSCS